jgi:hypothetical protein
MSIINNVLRDLELRSSQFTPIGVTPAGATVASKPQPQQFMPTLLGVLLLSGIVFGFWIYQQAQPRSKTVVANTSNASTVEVPSVVKTDATAEVLLITDVEESVNQPAVNQPLVNQPSVNQESVNQLIGMQFKESNDAVSLDFSLREKVVSYLKERNDKGFVFHLKNIESEIIAPVISDNRWIERLTITPQAGGLDISVRTLTGVLVETQQQQVEGELVWAITLRKLSSPVEIEAVQLDPNDHSLNANLEAQEATGQLNNQAIAKSAGSNEVNPEVVGKNKVVKLEIKSRSIGGDEVQQLKKARALILQRQFKKAETVLLGLIGGTQDLAARESLLMDYKRSKQPERLNELVSESMKRYPQHAAFITEYAQSLFKPKAYQQVIDFLQSQSNRNAVQLALIGASYQRLEQYQAAANFYRQSLKVDVDQSRNWIALGLAEEHNANLQQALAAYKTAKKQGNLNSRLIEFVDQRSRILEKIVN